MYLNVSTEAMSITPFEVGYEMAALTLYNKSSTWHIESILGGSTLLSSYAYISRYFWQNLPDFVTFTKLNQLPSSEELYGKKIMLIKISFVI